jgi:hypothetical protein
VRACARAFGERFPKLASRMLTWALADRLTGIPVTANALNPGYVVTDLTRQAGGLLRVAVVLTSFRAQTALDGADTAIWLAASPEADGITGKFWNKRREMLCRFRGYGGYRAALDTHRAADCSGGPNGAVTGPATRCRCPHQAGVTVRPRVRPGQPPNSAISATSHYRQIQPSVERGHASNRIQIIQSASSFRARTWFPQPTIRCIGPD